MRIYAALFDVETHKYSIIAKDDFDDFWYVYLKTNSRDRAEAIDIARRLSINA
jgi:hypothetical protein